MIDDGDIVVATRKGSQDARGLPANIPAKGKTYRVKRVYPMPYGLGCEIEGLNPFPYRGFLLYVSPSRASKWKKIGPDGWFFEKVEKADDEFAQSIARRKVMGGGPVPRHEPITMKDPFK